MLKEYLQGVLFVLAVDLPIIALLLCLPKIFSIAYIGGTMLALILYGVVKAKSKDEEERR